MLARTYYFLNQFERSKKMLDALLDGKFINGKDLSLISTTYGELYYGEFVKSEGKCMSCAKKAIDHFEKAVNYNYKNAQPYLLTIEIYQLLGSDEDVTMVKDLMAKNIK